MATFVKLIPEESTDKRVTHVEIREEGDILVRWENISINFETETITVDSTETKRITLDSLHDRQSIELTEDPIIYAIHTGNDYIFHVKDYYTILGYVSQERWIPDPSEDFPTLPYVYTNEDFSEETGLGAVDSETIITLDIAKADAKNEIEEFWEQCRMWQQDLFSYSADDPDVPLSGGEYLQAMKEGLKVKYQSARTIDDYTNVALTANLAKDGAIDVPTVDAYARAIHIFPPTPSFLFIWVTGDPLARTNALLSERLGIITEESDNYFDGFDLSWLASDYDVSISLTGNDTVGSLKVVEDLESGAQNITYIWERVDESQITAAIPTNYPWVRIDNNSNSYTLTSADVGGKIRVRVVYNLGAGTATKTAVSTLSEEITE